MDAGKTPTAEQPLVRPTAASRTMMADAAGEARCFDTATSAHVVDRSSSSSNRFVHGNRLKRSCSVHSDDLISMKNRFWEGKIMPVILLVFIEKKEWIMSPKQGKIRMTIVFGILAGFFAASASASAKLLFDDWNSMPIQAFFLIAFIFSNVMMWWNHTKALQDSASTLTVTVLNTGSNFLVTAAYALFVFNEQRSLLWYVGIAVILLGTAIVARSTNKSKSE
ncbi:hypothetical protein QR680_015722 [Steinernema hermaphroditum]|uniref:EamA domain-containing protein n=1 Tax=Steinernema hermaphroditum TaxID=289476 RepID=A0AA39H8R4_9BILA|nr:hypothetical protein QR680_015722 [Steinernema hermaphroditum]